MHNFDSNEFLEIGGLSFVLFVLNVTVIYAVSVVLFKYKGIRPIRRQLLNWEDIPEIVSKKVPEEQEGPEHARLSGTVSDPNPCSMSISRFSESNMQIPPSASQSAKLLRFEPSGSLSNQSGSKWNKMKLVVREAIEEVKEAEAATSLRNANNPGISDAEHKGNEEPSSDHVKITLEDALLRRLVSAAATEHTGRTGVLPAVVGWLLGPFRRRDSSLSAVDEEHDANSPRAADV